MEPKKLQLEGNTLISHKLTNRRVGGGLIIEFEHLEAMWYTRVTLNPMGMVGCQEKI